MAEFVAAALWEVGAAWATEAAIAIASNAAIINTALVVGANYAYTKGEQRQALRRARDAFNASVEDRLLMVDLEANAPGHVALGRVRGVEGIRRRWQSGAHSEIFTMIVSVACHEIDGFEKHFFGDAELELDANGWVLTGPFNKGGRESHGEIFTVDGSGTPIVINAGPSYAPGSAGAVLRNDGDQGADEPRAVQVVGSTITVDTVGTIAGQRISVGWQTITTDFKARIRTYLGTDDQNVGADLAAEYPDHITELDRFAGIALVVIDLWYDPDVFPTSLPQYSALFRGAKLYDPRTGLTQWSANPALCSRFYARYRHGWDLDDDDIRASDIVAAANECDVNTAFTLELPGGSSDTVNLPRYQCHMYFPTDSDPRAVMDEIVRCMAGKWGWAGGTWRLRAGASAAPVFALDNRWIAQLVDDEGNPSQEPPVQISKGVPRDQKVNKITGRCVDGEQRYQTLPFPDVEDEVVIAREGEYPQEVVYAGVNHIAHAQHLARCEIRQQLASLHLEVSCNLRAYLCELFDVGTVNLPRYGFNGIFGEVEGWSWSPTRGVTLQLGETSAAIYEPLPLYGRDPAPDSSLPPITSVPDIEGLDADSGTDVLGRSGDGGVIVRMKVRWDPIEDARVLTGGRVQVQWSRLADNVPAENWNTEEVEGSATEVTFGGMADGQLIVYRARAWNGKAWGSWSVQMVHLVVGESALPADITGAYYDLLPDGQVRIKWNRSTEADYGRSEWRLLAAGSYDNGTTIFSGDGDSFIWAPGFGTFQIGGKDYDRSGNESAGTSVLTFTLNGLVLISNSANATVNGTTVTKVAGGGGTTYNAGVYSREVYVGGAFCAYSPGAAGSDFLAGLNASDAGVATGYFDIDYSLYFEPAPAHRVWVYEGSTNRGQAGTWAVEDVFSTTYDGRVLAHWKNGALLAAKVVAPDLTMQFDCSLGTVGSVVQDIQFGPMAPKPSAALACVGYAFASDDGFAGKRATAANGWDSSVTSRDRAVGGCFVSFRPCQNDRYLVIGLDRDPTANVGDGTIDFAFYLGGGGESGLLYAIENGAFIFLSSYSAFDNMVLSFDGEFVRYTNNGALLRAVEARAFANVPLYLDSSFYQPGALVADLKLGPMSAAGSDVRFVARGGVQVRNRVLTKVTGGSGGWNADCYSIDGHTGGAFASAVIPGPEANYGQNVMFGLNSDPSADSSYASIDYAFYIHQNGNLYAFESGGDPAGALSAWSRGDQLMVHYDGYRVRYLQNGVIRRTVVAGAGRRFHFDSSFLWQNSALENVRFGPLSGVAQIDTEQITAEAATSVHTASYVSDVSATYPATSEQTLLTVTPPITPAKLILTMTFRGRCSASSVASAGVRTTYGALTTSTPDILRQTSSSSDRFSHTVRQVLSTSNDNPVSVKAYVSPAAVGETAVISDIRVNVEVIKL